MRAHCADARLKVGLRDQKDCEDSFWACSIKSSRTQWFLYSRWFSFKCSQQTSWHLDHRCPSAAFRWWKILLTEISISLSAESPETRRESVRLGKCQTQLDASFICLVESRMQASAFVSYLYHSYFTPPYRLDYFHSWTYLLIKFQERDQRPV